MGPPKNNCEVFFQRALKNLDKKKRGVSMGAETLESLTIKFEMILDHLKDIKEHLNDLPCKDHDSDIQENKFEIKHLKAAVVELKKEKDEEIYPRLRKAETKVATLIQQNKGQDEWSAKVWVFIMLGIMMIKEFAMYMLTRGVIP